MPLEIIISLAAVIILLLLFSLSIKVLKSSIKTLLIIAAILFMLQIYLGVSSQEILDKIVVIVTTVRQFITGNR